jgi:hypothetical protein
MKRLIQISDYLYIDESLVAKFEQSTEYGVTQWWVRYIDGRRDAVQEKYFPAIKAALVYEPKPVAAVDTFTCECGQKLHCSVFGLEAPTPTPRQQLAEKAVMAAPESTDERESFLDAALYHSPRYVNKPYWPISLLACDLADVYRIFLKNTPDEPSRLRVLDRFEHMIAWCEREADNKDERSETREFRKSGWAYGRGSR